MSALAARVITALGALALSACARSSAIPASTPPQSDGVRHVVESLPAPVFSVTHDARGSTFVARRACRPMIERQTLLEWPFYRTEREEDRSAGSSPCIGAPIVGLTVTLALADRTSAVSHTTDRNGEVRLDPSALRAPDAVCDSKDRPFGESYDLIVDGRVVAHDSLAPAYVAWQKSQRAAEEIVARDVDASFDACAKGESCAAIVHYEQASLCWARTPARSARARAALLDHEYLLAAASCRAARDGDSCDALLDWWQFYGAERATAHPEKELLEVLKAGVPSVRRMHVAKAVEECVNPLNAELFADVLAVRCRSAILDFERFAAHPIIAKHMPAIAGDLAIARRQADAYDKRLAAHLAKRATGASSVLASTAGSDVPWRWSRADRSSREPKHASSEAPAPTAYAPPVRMTFVPAAPKPKLLPTGAACTLGTQCEFGACSAGHCANASGRAAIGVSCSYDGDCASGACRRAVCVDRSGLLPAGASCKDDASCHSGDCEGGMCTDDAGFLASGASCTRAAVCSSGVCRAGVCADESGRAPLGARCAAGLECASHVCRKNLCAAKE